MAYQDYSMKTFSKELKECGNHPCLEMILFAMYGQRRRMFKRDGSLNKQGEIAYARLRDLLHSIQYLSKKIGDVDEVMDSLDDIIDNGG